MKNTLILISLLGLFVSLNGKESEPYNILWIVAEDTSPWLGCYGDTVNEGMTPNLDRLANDGVRFARAFVPAPVCSACRSAMMVGQNQIRSGFHEHRSSRGNPKIYLPDGMKLLPDIMRENGYATFNFGKDDYNFIYEPKETYSYYDKRYQEDMEKIPWEEIKANQPFFGQIQTKGGKNNTSKISPELKTDPSIVKVPNDYPQNQLYKETVAQHYDAIRKEDITVGNVLQKLEEHGLMENTIIVHWGDHGAPGLLRHKQMLTEGGLHVPFIISGPKDAIPGPAVRDELVDLLDLSAQTLEWAGIPIPEWYEGRPLFGKNAEPRNAVFSAKDRLDNTIDRARTVRTDKFRYNRNYLLDRNLLQPQYRDNRPFTINIREAYADGTLAPHLARIYFGEKPEEEFYDVTKDPAMVRNLIKHPGYAEEIRSHRKLLIDWVAKGDMGKGNEHPLELKQQMTEKWGWGPNPEYEALKEDTDRDGLSDLFETFMGRDPSDGRIVFEFDCGGWQTEGWGSREIEDNIAGYQNYLDFHLKNGRGTIFRRGLLVDPLPEDTAFAIKMRSSDKVRVTARANGKPLGGARTIEGSEEYITVKFPLTGNANWRQQVKFLQIGFRSQKDVFIEIDSIVVER
ncbi:MAG: sulfatase [Puniceicoccaceae bacterium]